MYEKVEINGKEYYLSVVVTDLIEGLFNDLDLYKSFYFENLLEIETLQKDKINLTMKLLSKQKALDSFAKLMRSDLPNDVEHSGEIELTSTEKEKQDKSFEKMKSCNIEINKLRCKKNNEPYKED